MSEFKYDRRIFTLAEVSASIKKSLAERYSSSFWVKAEMNKLNFYPGSGHCYPELLDKQNDRVVAQMKSTLWRDDFIRINKKFKDVLGEPLKDGIKILFLARITYDAVHGLSLGIQDIDPAFTLGDLEMEKQEAILRLRRENLFDKNKLLELPYLPQRIAVISVETSKGYADFNEVIVKNPEGYSFFQMMFPALLQGDKAVKDIIAQLDKIRKVIRHFDIVTIIRGGGGDVGLSCFNNYELARAICEFPIPVLTGIGHSTNETVCEMISHTNAITPTKLAELLIQKFNDFAFPLRECEELIAEYALQILEDEKDALSITSKLFRSVAINNLSIRKAELKQVSYNYLRQVAFRFNAEYGKLSLIKRDVSRNSNLYLNDLSKELIILTDSLGKETKVELKNLNSKLEAIQRNVSILSPENVLKRGYSITTLNGKALRSVEGLEQGTTITTALAEGTITSIIQTTNNTEGDEG